MMSKLTTEQVKPENINYKDGFWNTVWRKCEKETIARNIVLNAQKAKAGWGPGFTGDEYDKACTHKVGYGEHGILDGFVADGFLDFNEDQKRYFVNDKFLAALMDYWIDDPK